MAWSMGLLGAAGAGVEAAGSFDLLETTVLGSNQSSVSFTNLNSTYGSDYTHLQVRLSGRSTRNSSGDGVKININNDFGANYSNHRMETAGSSITSKAGSNATYSYAQRVAGATQSSEIFGSIIIDFTHAFDTSKNTTTRALGGFADEIFALSGGAYYSSSPLDQIYLSPPSGDFVIGSRFSLYGIKAA